MRFLTSILPTIVLVVAIIATQFDSASAQFGLQDYIINAPDCSVTTDLNVQCDYTGVLPLDGNIANFITGFDGCQGYSTRDSELSLSAATGNAVNGDYSVTVDILTDFNLADGESEIFTFCLMTHLRDTNDNLMIYHGQKINTTFTSDSGFIVSGIDSELFDAVNSDVDTDSKVFGVTAKRCDISRAEISSPPIGVGDTLMICIDAVSPNVVIQSVDEFYGIKPSIPQTDLLWGNTEVIGEGTNAVTIGTRPYTMYFQDADLLDVFGTVTLGIPDNGVRKRHLVEFHAVETDSSDRFDVLVQVEPQSQSRASSPLHYSGAVVTLAWIAVAMSVL